jgi:hypothetical protein
MKTTIHKIDNGWFAQNGNSTTQLFASREELMKAIETENNLIREQNLCDDAVPADSPLNWE